MKYFNYRWYGYDLLISCQKCGNKVPFQGIQGNPQCDDCGYVMKQSWPDVLKHADIDDLKKQGKEANNITIMGGVNANVSTTWVEGVPCVHCKQTIKVAADTPPENIVCHHCSKPSPAAASEVLQGLVFYKSGKGGSNQGPLDMVAVRCASCGAPLQADPSKTNYHCGFCKTENILPPAMRRKVVLDDMYVGVQIPRHDASEAFKANSAEYLRRILRDNKKSDYTDEQLNEMILRFPNELSVLNFIRYEYKHEVPTATYEQLWNTTRHYSVLAETGRALKKSNEEIEAKGGKWESAKKPVQATAAKQKKSKANKTEKYLVIAILIGLVLYFGWQTLRHFEVL